MSGWGVGWKGGCPGSGGRGGADSCGRDDEGMLCGTCGRGGVGGTGAGGVHSCRSGCKDAGPDGGSVDGLEDEWRVLEEMELDPLIEAKISAAVDDLCVARPRDGSGALPGCGTEPVTGAAGPAGQMRP